MKSVRPVWRIAIATLISIALHGVLLAIDFSIDFRQDKLSRVESVVVAVLTPAEKFTAWLAPGHGGAQILLPIVFSVVIYAIVAWAVLSLPIWWRNRI